MRDTFVVDWKHVLATEVRLRLDEALNPTKHEMGMMASNGSLIGEPTLLECYQMTPAVFFDSDSIAIEAVASRKAGAVTPARRGALAEAVFTALIDIFPGLDYSGLPAAHAGTLDVILINDDATECLIPDYKSHPRPFDPDTYQSMLYPFMAFKHIPSLRKVIFRLVFVRYGADVIREVAWTRDQMPEMATQLRRARERQLALEAEGQGPALPGAHCQYCPKLSRPTLCSIADFNPQINETMEERLRFNVWASEMAKINRAVLKDAVDGSGRPITILDANGKRYEFGCHPTESQVFPLDETFIQLTRNQIAVSTDTWESMKLRVSSTRVKGLMKAKKRDGYRSALEGSVVEMEVKPKFGIRRPDGDVDTGYSQDEDI